MSNGSRREQISRHPNMDRLLPHLRRITELIIIRNRHRCLHTQPHPGTLRSTGPALFKEYSNPSSNVIMLRKKKNNHFPSSSIHLLLSAGDLMMTMEMVMLVRFKELNPDS
jgi:hypothetical protein